MRRPALIENFGQKVSAWSGNISKSHLRKRSYSFSGTGSGSTGNQEPSRFRRFISNPRSCFASGVVSGVIGSSVWRNFRSDVNNDAMSDMIISKSITIDPSKDPLLDDPMPLRSYFDIVRHTNVTFDDIHGCDETKQELRQIVDFLHSPEKYRVLGAKLPKGVLLSGPPGVGKTMIAKAVAGEAEVPFYSIVGSEFDDMFVGSGAKKIRTLFADAKRNSPCVIFIDEIDSVASKRVVSQSHPYANQTLNQLLCEMDGFSTKNDIIIIAATNRPEALDKAVLRPGRFDIKIDVPLPDQQGRERLFKYYLNKVETVVKDNQITELAKFTIGKTGADIMSIVNQAAIHAGVVQAKLVTMEHLLFSLDKNLYGHSRSRLSDEKENYITACHEAGHAIVALFTQDSSPIHKVTIIPRGKSLGHTAFIPKNENESLNRSEILNRIDRLMGGRVAEEMIFGNEKITTGASEDLKMASDLAMHLVTQWGMSSNIGLRKFDPDSLVAISQTTKESIDKEVKAILDASYDRVKALIQSHIAEHTKLTNALLKYDTVDADDIKAVLAGNENILIKKRAQNKQNKITKTTHGNM